MPFTRGTTPLKGLTVLTIVADYLLTGMILQVAVISIGLVRTPLIGLMGENNPTYPFIMPKITGPKNSHENNDRTIRRSHQNEALGRSNKTGVVHLWPLILPNAAGSNVKQVVG